MPDCPRFLAFGCEAYYPDGGWADFECGFATLEDAKETLQELKTKWDWVQVVDLQSMKEVPPNRIKELLETPTPHKSCTP